MPTITSVEPQKKHTGRFNIFIDGEFAFGADEDLVVEYRLVHGKILAAPDMAKLLFEAEIGKLMEKMYRLWGIRQRTEREVRDYLKIKNSKLKIQNGEEISELVIEALVNKLKEKKLVDDRHFAQAWVEARRNNKKKGIRAIKAELFQKGISKEIIEEVISGQVTGYSEEALAEQALEKKIKYWKNIEPKKLRQRATEFLLRRGFEYDVAKDVVEKAVELM